MSTLWRILLGAVAITSTVAAADTTSYDGMLFASSQVVLSTLSGGVVTELPYREGQKVAAGRVVLRLDGEKDSLSLELARRKLERSQIEKTGEVESAIEVQMREIALREKSVTAPFSGVIVKVMAKQHEYVGPGYKAVEIADLSRLVTEIHVTAADLKKIVSGKASIAVERGGERVKAEYLSHGPLAEPGVELFLVKLVFVNKYAWAPGTSVKARL
jgi:multidrug efflux system membrane fusion protein